VTFLPPPSRFYLQKAEKSSITGIGTLFDVYSAVRHFLQTMN